MVGCYLPPSQRREKRVENLGLIIFYRNNIAKLRCIMKTNKIIIAALGVALVGVGVNANAATATGTLSPSLTIIGACTVAVTNAPFPSVPNSTVAGTVISGQIGTVTVAGCSGGSYWLGANGGLVANFGTVGAARNLSSGTHANDMGYTLDLGGAAGTQLIWGTVGMPTPITPGPTGTAYQKIGASASDSYTVTGHATITALALAAGAAVYTDTVTVTVEF